MVEFNDVYRHGGNPVEQRDYCKDAVYDMRFSHHNLQALWGAYRWMRTQLDLGYVWTESSGGDLLRRYRRAGPHWVLQDKIWDAGLYATVVSFDAAKGELTIVGRTYADKVLAMAVAREFMAQLKEQAI